MESGQWVQPQIDHDALTGGSKYSAIPSAAPTDTQPPKRGCVAMSRRQYPVGSGQKQLQECITTVKSRIPSMVILFTGWVNEFTSDVFWDPVTIEPDDLRRRTSD